MLETYTIEEFLLIPREDLIKQSYNELTIRQKKYYYGKYGKPPRCQRCNSRLKLRYKSDDEIICDNGCYKQYNGDLGTIIEYEENQERTLYEIKKNH
jgi:hypothetical protein